MVRTNAREFAVRLVYELGFDALPVETLLSERLDAGYFEEMAGEDKLYRTAPGVEQAEYVRKLVSGVALHMAELDGYVAKYAVGWDFGRISRVALAVMRVTMYEVMYMHDVPPAAAINAAVDITKRLASPEAASFVNGILGSFSRGELPVEEKA